MAFRLWISILAISATLFFSSISGQITSPCTTAMITNFTPCLNFVTNINLNGTSPTQVCCNSLKSIMSSGAGCFCQIATGNIPFRIPINRTLAVSLPRACNSQGVPLQCNVAEAPVPGPLAKGPSIPPVASPSPSVEEPSSPSLAPEADAVPTQPSEANNGGDTAGNAGSREGVGSSAASPQYYSIWPLHTVALLGALSLSLKYY